MVNTAAPTVLKGEALRQRIREERGWAARKILGQKPWGKQLEIEKAVIEGPLMATEVSGCVSSTKTYALAMVALVHLMSWKPSRVFSIAPSFRQVDANLWGYMKTLWMAAKRRGTPIGRDDQIYRIPKIDLSCAPDCAKNHVHVTDWYYEGFTTDDPGNVHGLHGPHDLVILDDAQGIGKPMMDELENMRANAKTRFVLAYNKTMLSGPTYDATHLEARFYNHVGISFDDLQAARAAGFVLDGALEQAAVDRWAFKYGKHSNFFKVKVLNQHPSQEADTLIPLSWVELAFQRKTVDTGDLVEGADVASEGDDSNCKAPLRGMTVFPLEEWQEPDTMVTVGRFVADIKAEETHENLGVQKSKAFVFMDACGLGGPMVNRAAEQTNRVEGHSLNCVGCQTPVKVLGLNGAESPIGVVKWDGKTREASEIFVNIRSQMYWALRESLNPANPPETLIALPADMDLSAQLTCIKFRTRSDGKIEVEPKIGLSVKKGGKANWGIKRRLGFSPDKADAVKYANWGRTRLNFSGFGVAALPGTTRQEAEGKPGRPLTSAELAAQTANQAPKGFGVASSEPDGVFVSGVAEGGLEG